LSRLVIGEWNLDEKENITTESNDLFGLVYRRRISAMGGMAAHIPVKNDQELNDQNMNAVRQDKLLEVESGHDGTWVAHPGLVRVAMEVFDNGMQTDNQIQSQGEKGEEEEDEESQRIELSTLPELNITRGGILANIRPFLRYTIAFLGGIGCIPLNHKVRKKFV